MLFFWTGASAQFEQGTVVEGVCIDSFSLSAAYFHFFSTIHQQRPRENDTRPRPLHLRSINPPFNYIFIQTSARGSLNRVRSFCHLPQQLKETADSLVITIFKIKNQSSRMDFCVLIRTRHHEQKKSLTVAKFLIFGVLAFVPSYVSTTL